MKYAFVNIKNLFVKIGFLYYIIVSNLVQNHQLAPFISQQIIFNKLEILMSLHSKFKHFILIFFRDSNFRI